MGIDIYNPHNVGQTFCTGVHQSAFSLQLSTCKSFLRRRKFDFFFSVNADPPSQAKKAGTAEKFNFTQPKWLLPAEDKKRRGATDQTSNEIVFQVVLTTSKDYGSDISDLNAGILLALIGEHGICFVHRIPTLVLGETAETTEELCTSRPSHYRFQRGSQDVVTFCGPDLGKLEAVWVAPEKSTWRMAGLCVRVFSEQLHEDDKNIVKDTGCKFLQYDFVCEEVIIGENANNSAAELKLFKVSEIPYCEKTILGSKSMPDGLQAPLAQLRDEGMKEYDLLKFSMLGYDALLVTVGSAVATAMGSNEVAEGYFVGGLLGFLYLFVLEKAVDQLPAPLWLPVSNDGESSAKDSTKIVEGKTAKKGEQGGTSLFEEKDRPAGSLYGFRGPLTKLSGILALSLLIVKSLYGTNSQAISKQMLLAGVAGFLMSKLAAILASVMPISLKQVLSIEEEV